MEEPRPAIPHPLNSSRVLLRFALRLVLMSTFATFGPQSFATTFVSLLALSAVFCAVVGAMRQEALLGPVLTHWDEAVACALVGRAVSLLQ